MDIELQVPRKIYHAKHHALYNCMYHIVFCPKYRRKVFTDEIAARLKEIVVEKQHEYGYSALALEVLPDHVHLLLDIDLRLGVFDTITKIKGCTSRILRAEFPELVRKLPTLWTRGKFVSSVGSVSLETVKKYIESQKNI